MNNMTDLEAFAKGSDFVAKYWDHTADGRENFRIDLAAVFSNRPGDCIAHPSGCFGGADSDASNAYNVGGFGDSGFASTFRDSKYLSDGGTSNQIYHTEGGGINFAAAGDNHYEEYSGLSLMRKTNYEWMTFHETSQKKWKKPDSDGNCGSSWEDLFSSYIGIQMGESLRNGSVSPRDFGNLIRTQLGNNDHSIDDKLINKVPKSSEWEIKKEDMNMDRFKNYKQENKMFDQSKCPKEY
jgi:hypothetical protein